MSYMKCAQGGCDERAITGYGYCEDCAWIRHFKTVPMSLDTPMSLKQIAEDFRQHRYSMLMYGVHSTALPCSYCPTETKTDNGDFQGLAGRYKKDKIIDLTKEENEH